MEFWAHVEKLVESLTTISHFELLGLDESAFEEAGPTSLTDAYHAALRTYHPDRHAVGTSVEHKLALARICARVGEAYRVLSSATERADYVEKQAAGMSSANARTKRATYAETRDPKGEKARRMLESARDLARAGNASGARAKIDLALQFEPDSVALAQARAGLDPKTNEEPAAPKCAAGEESS